jgi:SOS-response transcriptional repressor LexA
LTSLSERLANARKDAGFSTKRDAANSISVGYSTYASHENGSRKPKTIELALYAKRFGVSVDWLLYGKNTGQFDGLEVPVTSIRVEGISQAGMFRDISLIDDDEHERKEIPIPVNTKYAHAHQYALLVCGDSMNNQFKDGSYVACAAWVDLGMELKSGMVLHVERIKAASMIETTIKTYIERDGKRWLEPNSTNAKHLPIEVNGDLDTEIIIKGAVIGTYTEINL